MRAVSGPAVSGTGRRRARARAGFTLVEVLMALTILSIGLLAIAGLAATSLRAVRGGAAQTRAAAAAASRFDSLASVPCDHIAASTSTAVVSRVDSSRGVREKWSAQRVNNGNMVRVTDTLTVPGRAVAFAYTSMRACR